MFAQPDAFSCGLYSLTVFAQPDAFSCGLYSLTMFAQPDRRTGPSLIPRGAFLASLGAARLGRGRSLRLLGLEPNCLERGRSLRPLGLEPAWGTAVAALIPANIRVTLGRCGYKRH